MSKIITSWLKHDYNSRRDPKILAIIEKYGFTGYGRYWALIEFLAEQGGYIKKDDEIYKNALKNELKYKKITELEEFLKELLKIGLLIESEDDSITSKRLEKDLLEKNEISLKKKDAIKKRWENKNKTADTDVLQKNNISNTEVIPVEESRVEESREEKSIYITETEILSFAEAENISKETAKEFYNYYSAIGWKTLSGIKIIDWKAKLKGWKSNGSKNEDKYNLHDYNWYLSEIQKNRNAGTEIECVEKDGTNYWRYKKN